MTLLAYHSDPMLKEHVMQRIAAHREADEIRQRWYYKHDLTGEVSVCAVGCLLHDPKGGHKKYETQFGIPVHLAYLEDALFEAMSPEDAKEWPGRFMGAIEPGVDLSEVWHRFASWLLLDNKWGVANHVNNSDMENLCWDIANAFMHAPGSKIPEPVRESFRQAISKAQSQTIWTDVLFYLWRANETPDLVGDIFDYLASAHIVPNNYKRLVKAAANKLIELIEVARINQIADELAVVGEVFDGHVDDDKAADNDEITDPAFA